MILTLPEKEKRNPGTCPLAANPNQRSPTPNKKLTPHKNSVIDPKLVQSSVLLLKIGKCWVII